MMSLYPHSTRINGANIKPLANMSHPEMKMHLLSFRDAWENITTRNTDLSDERLDDETLKDLQDHLKFYYSNHAKLLVEDWLRTY